ncbi:GerAB/ArcD/ProY family transporter [Bacillus wiedmannii]|uniref:GerAB/ArcD/ProY family transporter n=1 Tax=Bacillus wiedmannii TaxID=1890302 RepID=UPI0027316AA4|nr:GerAB/ArcD/ProY family transporter [Bacillus wiedmannii]MDP1460074.1 GerAB/ArcD/ProY family transporter [Bacillus wiedmannii]
MKIKINYKIAPAFAFFIIHEVQFGAGVLGFSRIIAKEAGYDAWIGVLIAGIIIHGLIWLIYHMLSLVNGSILSIHTYVFGSILGNLLNIVFIIYFFVFSISILRTYIEIVQIWLYPDASTFILAIVLSFLIYYIISSGFRVMTGICVIAIFISCIYILLCFYCLIRYGHFDNFLPVLNHRPSEIFLAAKGSIYTMAGFEIILMIYPFIHSPKDSHKFAQYGALFSNLIYLLSAISALAFFSEKQLSHVIWSQLSMIKIIEFPFLESINQLVIAGYALSMITSIILPLWAATRGMREVFHIRQKYILIGVLILSIIISMLLKDRHTTNTFVSLVSSFSLYLMYVYIPILCMLVYIKVKIKK